MKTFTFVPALLLSAFLGAVSAGAEGLSETLTGSDIHKASVESMAKPADTTRLQRMRAQRTAELRTDNTLLDPDTKAAWDRWNSGKYDNDALKARDKLLLNRNHQQVQMEAHRLNQSGADKSVLENYQRRHNEWATDMDRRYAEAAEKVGLDSKRQVATGKAKPGSDYDGHLVGKNGAQATPEQIAAARREFNRQFNDDLSRAQLGTHKNPARLVDADGMPINVTRENFRAAERIINADGGMMYGSYDAVQAEIKIRDPSKGPITRGENIAHAQEQMRQMRSHATEARHTMDRGRAAVRNNPGESAAAAEARRAGRQQLQEGQLKGEQGGKYEGRLNDGSDRIAATADSQRRLSDTADRIAGSTGAESGARRPAPPAPADNGIIRKTPAPEVGSAPRTKPTGRIDVSRPATVSEALDVRNFPEAARVAGPTTAGQRNQIVAGARDRIYQQDFDQRVRAGESASDAARNATITSRQQAAELAAELRAQAATRQTALDGISANRGEVSRTHAAQVSSSVENQIGRSQERIASTLVADGDMRGAAEISRNASAAQRNQILENTRNQVYQTDYDQRVQAGETHAQASQNAQNTARQRTGELASEMRANATRDVWDGKNNRWQHNSTYENHGDTRRPATGADTPGGRVPADAPQTRMQTARGVLTDVGQAMAGADFINAGDDVLRAGRGEITATEAVVNTVDGFSGGAISSVRMLGTKGEDASTAYSRHEQANRSEMEAYGQRMALNARQAGATRGEARALLDAVRAGNNADAMAIRNELSQRGVTFQTPQGPEMENALSSTYMDSDNVLQRGGQVLSGMAQQGGRIVDFSRRTGENLGTLAVDVGAATVDSFRDDNVRQALEAELRENLSAENLSQAPGAMVDIYNANQVTHQSQAIHQENARGIADRLIREGASVEDAQRAADSYLQGDFSTVAQIRDQYQQTPAEDVQRVQQMIDQGNPTGIEADALHHAQLGLESGDPDRIAEARELMSTIAEARAEDPNWDHHDPFAAGVTADNQDRVTSMINELPPGSPERARLEGIRNRLGSSDPDVESSAYTDMRNAEYEASLARDEREEAMQVASLTRAQEAWDQENATAREQLNDLLGIGGPDMTTPAPAAIPEDPNARAVEQMQNENSAMQSIAANAQQQMDALDEQIANARNSQERAELEAQRAAVAQEMAAAQARIEENNTALVDLGANPGTGEEANWTPEQLQNDNWNMDSLAERNQAAMNELQEQIDNSFGAERRQLEEEMAQREREGRDLQQRIDRNNQMLGNMGAPQGDGTPDPYANSPWTNDQLENDNAAMDSLGQRTDERIGDLQDQIENSFGAERRQLEEELASQQAERQAIDDRLAENARWIESNERRENAEIDAEWDRVFGEEDPNPKDVASIADQMWDAGDGDTFDEDRLGGPRPDGRFGDTFDEDRRGPAWAEDGTGRLGQNERYDEDRVGGPRPDGRFGDTFDEDRRGPTWEDEGYQETRPRTSSTGDDFEDAEAGFDGPDGGRYSDDFYSGIDGAEVDFSSRSDIAEESEWSRAVSDEQGIADRADRADEAAQQERDEGGAEIARSRGAQESSDGADAFDSSFGSTFGGAMETLGQQIGKGEKDENDTASTPPTEPPKPAVTASSSSRPRARKPRKPRSSASRPRGGSRSSGSRSGGSRSGGSRGSRSGGGGGGGC